MTTTSLGNRRGSGKPEPGLGRRPAGFPLGFIDLRPGEGRLLAKLTSALFFIVLSHTLLETARDALFLEELPPARLPLVYATLAVLVLLATHVNTRFVQRFGTRTGLIFTLFVAAYATTMAHLAPKTAAVVFGLYLFSGLFASVATVQFWMLAGQLFTLAQGKRLFATLTAGGVLGAVFGGLVAVVALRWYEVSSLLLLAVGSLFVAALVLTTFGTEDALVPPAKAEKLNASAVLASLKQEPYLGFVAALVALSTAALLITDYLFKSTAAHDVPASALGMFFAAYYGILNATALVVQVFLAGYLLRRASVIFAFSILPLLLLIGSGSILVLGGALLAVLLTKAADGGLRHSLHRIATELLWLPLSEQTRQRTKPLVDGAGARLTQALSAGLILGLAAYDLDTPQVLAGFVFVLALSWVSLSLWLRRPYLDLFRQALQGRSRGELALDLNSVEVVVEALSSRDPSRAIAAMDLLAQNDRHRLIPALILYHESEQVLIAALQTVPSPERGDWIPLAERLLSHEAEAVRVAAMRALSKNRRLSAVADRLNDISPTVRGHAVFLLVDDEGRARPGDDPRVRELLSIEGQAGMLARLGLLEAIKAQAGSRWIEVVLLLTEDGREEVLRAAASTMTSLQDPRFIPFLIRRLGHREGRDDVRSALVAHGREALLALNEQLEQLDTDPRVRRHIPRTISRFLNQDATDMLLDRLEREPQGLVRYKVLRGLGRLVADTTVRVDHKRLEAQLLQNLREHFRLLSFKVCLEVEPVLGAAASDVPSVLHGAVEPSLDLLLGLLQDKLNQSLERVFRLLQMMHRHEDIRSVARAIRSTSRRTRSQAQEFLEALTANSTLAGVRSLLRLLVDDLSDRERVVRAGPHASLPSSREQALLEMLKDSDDALSTIAAYHGLALGLDPLKRAVAQLSAEKPLLTSLRQQFESFWPSVRGVSLVP